MSGPPPALQDPHCLIIRTIGNTSTSLATLEGVLPLSRPRIIGTLTRLVRMGLVAKQRNFFGKNHRLTRMGYCLTPTGKNLCYALFSEVYIPEEYR